jgi:hypothetical protein
MLTYTISFCDPVDKKDPGRVGKYSKVYKVLERLYGGRRLADNDGAVFRGDHGEVAVLTDRGKNLIFMSLFWSTPQ